MTRVEIVEAAVEHLNRVKNTNLKILSCYLNDGGTVIVKVAYPKVIINGDPNKRSYNFTSKGFEEPDPFDDEGIEEKYLPGFKCPPDIRDDQEKLSILGIAYWFYQNGKRNNAF